MQCVPIIWQGCVAGLSGADCAVGSAVTVDWQGALSYCEALVWNGSDAWRTPNVLEGMSLIDCRYTPCLDPAAFPNRPNQDIWSATTFSTFAADAVFSVELSEGLLPMRAKSGVWPVQCVRD